eukprot:1715106-Prymnesium_polylepis.1
MFLIDTVLHFFTPYRDRDGGIASTWVYDNRKIAMHYLHGFFVLDVVSLVPFDIIVMVTVDSEDGGGGSGLRVLRMLRVVKLARIMRASRILDRWENHWGVSYAKTALI